MGDAASRPGLFGAPSRRGQLRRDHPMVAAGDRLMETMIEAGLDDPSIDLDLGAGTLTARWSAP
ncbi:MAG TPA: hypothetical protein VMX12_03195 [Acidimicrobiia bacterium]|nr:hypothetical protein [Acidimicrobiia bacterium]